MTTQSDTATSNANNPFHRTADSYDRKIRLPIVRSIRNAEERAVRATFEQHIRPQDTVLEIGCGTGYYTRYIAPLAGRVIALDDSATMLEITRQRIDAKLHSRTEFVKCEGSSFVPDGEVDVVVHIGVLDYVAGWRQFLDHSLRHASRALIFTCPGTGPSSQCFALASRFSGVRIQRFRKRDLEGYFTPLHSEWKADMRLVGAGPGWIGSATWVVACTRVNAG